MGILSGHVAVLMNLIIIMELLLNYSAKLEKGDKIDSAGEGLLTRKMA